MRPDEMEGGIEYPRDDDAGDADDKKRLKRT